MPRSPRKAENITAAAAVLRSLTPRHAATANMLDDIASGAWTLTRGDHIAPADIIGNHQVRRLAGNITRATLIRWRDGVGVPAPFPAPAATVAGVNLWNRRVVQTWIAEHRPTERTT